MTLTIINRILTNEKRCLPPPSPATPPNPQNPNYNNNEKEKRRSPWSVHFADDQLNQTSRCDVISTLSRCALLCKLTSVKSLSWFALLFRDTFQEILVQDREPSNQKKKQTFSRYYTLRYLLANSCPCVQEICQGALKLGQVPLVWRCI